MKLKKLTILFLTAVLVLCVIGIIACTPTITDYDMSGVTFEGASVVYDGTAKTLAVKGSLPEGVTVAYEYYLGETKVTEAKEVGKYTVKAIFTGDSQHNSIAPLTAMLTISYNTSGLLLNNKTVVYSGENQTLTVDGTLPNGVTVAYEYYLGETKVNEAKNAGVYTVKAKFTTPNADLVINDLTATLTINKADRNVTLGATKEVVEDAELELSDAVIFDRNGKEYSFEYSGKTYVVDVLAPQGVPAKNIAYYTAINEDGSVKDATETTDNYITNAGDCLYVAVKLDATENYNEQNLVLKVTMNKLTVKISTYEELCKLNSDRELYSKSYRMNMRYELQNDIDCDGAVWMTICPAFGADNNPFSSEFDGNGHTISNFLLNNQSIGDKLMHTHGPHLGFFGYITDSYIHDVTFDNVTASFTRDGYTWSGGNTLYFGFVVARMEMDGSNGGETDLENVTVINSSANLLGYKIHAGGIVGEEHAKLATTKRDTLKVENVEIYALSPVSSSYETAVGGLIGRTQADNVLVYNNCEVKDIKLGYDQVKWKEKETENGVAENELMPGWGGNNIVGAFIGKHDAISATFNDCHVTGNWRMCANAMQGWFGKSSRNDWDENVQPIYTNIILNNCTHTDMISESDDGSVDQEIGFHWINYTDELSGGKWASNFKTSAAE